jgi:hypothetical protein
MEIYHDGRVKIWPDCLFLAFTTIEHFEDPRIANLSSLYQIVILLSTFSCGIIQGNGHQVLWQSENISCQGIVARDKLRLMKKLTNRELARVFGVSLTQIKRWAVIILGRDPDADQSGGVRREYTIDDAFMISLFGEILVRQFGIGLKEAKVHMDHIMPELKAEKLLPSNFNFNYGSPDKSMQFIPSEIRIKAENETKKEDIKNQFPFVNINIFPSDNQYLLERGIFSYIGDIDVNGKQKSEIHSIGKYFPIGYAWHFVPGPKYVILYDICLELFMDRIK